MKTPINIIISGYGKMGKTIEKIVAEKGYTLLYHVDNQEEWNALPSQFPPRTVVIDFSMSDVTETNIRHCFKIGLPIVVGTTGWYNHLEAITQLCEKQQGSLLYAPNFSIGVHVLFYLNRELARIMGHIEGYKAEIKEVHHIHKVDAPSGTAIQLAQDILAENPLFKRWIHNAEGTKDELSVFSQRKGEVPGIHEVLYDSSIDRITLKHEAKSREGFARGAIMAAEFLIDKKGVFTINNLLKTIGI